jgi:sec-independent protein translocase protein TatB
MFDLDVGKILVVGTIALIVVGPKDLPRVLRAVGQVVGKMRRMANEVQNQVMDAVKEADLEGVKKEFNAINESAKFDVSVNPASAMRGHSSSTPETSGAHAAAPLNAEAPVEASFASPEMKAYLDLLPGSAIGGDIAKIEVANENVEKEITADSASSVQIRRTPGDAA